MKLRNKKTGEIIREAEITVRTRCPENDEGDTLAYDEHGEYTSLAKLNAEWEDYDEKAEEEAIAMLEQLSEAIDRMNANMAKICGNFTICGKGKK